MLQALSLVAFYANRRTSGGMDQKIPRQELAGTSGIIKIRTKEINAGRTIIKYVI